MKNSISIIIPIYNEAKNISKLNCKLRKYLKKLRFEIIFVDDDSNDGSQEILKKQYNKYRNFRYIIRKNKKRDLTRSCFDGIKFSKYRLVLIMDGDLQHNPKYIVKMLKIHKKYHSDIVVGARDLIKGKNPGLGFIRKLSSIIILFFFNLINKKTIDPMSGFFLFNKKIYQRNRKRYFGKGYKILADIIYNSKENLRVNDLIIVFDRRINEKSKMSFKVLINLIKLYFFILLK